MKLHNKTLNMKKEYLREVEFKDPKLYYNPKKKDEP